MVWDCESTDPLCVGGLWENQSNPEYVSQADWNVHPAKVVWSGTNWFVPTTSSDFCGYEDEMGRLWMDKQSEVEQPTLFSHRVEVVPWTVLQTRCTTIFAVQMLHWIHSWCGMELKKLTACTINRELSYVFHCIVPQFKTSQAFRRQLSNLWFLYCCHIPMTRNPKLSLIMAIRR